MRINTYIATCCRNLKLFAFHEPPLAGHSEHTSSFIKSFRFLHFGPFNQTLILFQPLSTASSLPKCPPLLLAQFSACPASQLSPHPPQSSLLAANVLRKWGPEHTPTPLPGHPLASSGISGIWLFCSISLSLLTIAPVFPRFGWGEDTQDLCLFLQPAILPVYQL